MKQRTTMDKQALQNAGFNSLAAMAVGYGATLLNSEVWAGVVLILGGVLLFGLREVLKK